MSAKAAAAANLAWLLSSAAPRRRFDDGCRDVERTQRKLLRNLLSSNSASEYGRTYGFDRLRDAESFADAVPVVAWDELETWVERIAAGYGNVLTGEPVQLLEPTSGTTGPQKLVPVTRSLKGVFAEAAAVWIGDIFSAFPNARAGRSYWSLTPLGAVERRTSGGVPVGFDEDAEYFGPVRRRLVNAATAVPGEVRLAHDVDTACYLTLLFLLATPDLSLVSAWSPTFMTALLDRLPVFQEQLLADLSDGRIRPPGGIDVELARSLGRHIVASPRRALEIERIRAQHACPRSACAELWPRLAVVSCWADANAAEAAETLAAIFPSATLQPKGLLATEAFSSIPLAAAVDPVVAVGTHFFEFLTETGDALPCWKLEEGAEYEVVVTTQGGLYRCRTGDRVQVTGRYHQAPTIRFKGKTGLVSDVVGEKLSESHARTAIEALDAEGAELTMAFVAFCAERGGYDLYVVSDRVTGAVQDPRWASAAERALSANPHYRYARSLGQLEACRVVLVSPDAGRCFIDEHVRTGMRAGDVKLTALSLRTDWDRVFAQTGCIEAR